MKRKSHFKRWLSYVAKYKTAVIGAVLFLIIGMCIGIIIPKTAGYVIDHFLTAEVINSKVVTLPLIGITSALKAFVIVFSLLISLMILRAFSNFKRSTLLARTGENIHVDIRQALFAHLQKLPISYFDTSYTGRIMAHITTDADALWHLLYNGVIEIFGQSLLSIVIILILFTIHWQLALITLLVLPLLIFIMHLTRKRAFTTGRIQRENISRLYSRLQERISGIRLIRVFGRSEYENLNFSIQLKELYHNNIKLVTTYTILGVTVDFLTQAVLILVLCAGGFAVVYSQQISINLSTGELVTFYLYVSMLLTPISSVINSVSQHVTNAEVSMERIFGLLDTPSAPEEQSGKASCPRLKGEISFNQVCFSYRKDHQVITDLNFKILAGQTVALVGPSGSGKSTAVNMLCRFYSPTSGSILVDGRDISQWESDSYRNNISYVSQENFLFSGSIKDNLLFGRTDATMAEIEEAADRANALQFIRLLPQKFETEVGERGVMLSGGQKQRLNIARALLRNPSILILDEPTSALDAESESIILEALESVFKGKTCIIIAHRLSTVINSDQILVIDKGSLAQTGTHHQLVSQAGVYRELCKKQFIGFDGNQENNTQFHEG